MSLGHYVTLSLSTSDCATSFSLSDFQGLAARLAALAEPIILRITVGPGGEPAARLALQACAEHRVLVWIAAPAALCSAFARAPKPLAVTVTGVSPEPDGLYDVTARLYDAGVIVEIERDDGNSRVPENSGVWRVVRQGAVPEYLPLFAITGDGRGARNVDHVVLTTPRAITELAVEHIQHELRLGAIPSAPVWSIIPSPAPVDLRDGRRVRSYSIGGTQARGFARTQLEAQAALGFTNEREFEEWVGEVAKDKRLASAFPQFVGQILNAGVFQSAGKTIVRKPRADHQHSLLVLASWLAQGRREEAEALLGLRRGWFDGPDHRTGLAELDEQELRGFVERAAETLVRAICVVCRAPIGEETKVAAAECLALIGSRRARDVAPFLAELSPGLDAAMKRLRNRTARERVAKADENVGLALVYLSDAIERACHRLRGRS